MNLDAWLDYIANQHQQTIDMGLSRTEEMVRRLQLQQPAPKVVTVAGTNGKSHHYRAGKPTGGAGLRVLSTSSRGVKKGSASTVPNYQMQRFVRCCDRGAPAGACYRLNL